MNDFGIEQGLHRKGDQASGIRKLRSPEEQKDKSFKRSAEPSDFIFEIDVGKKSVQHKTTLNLSFQSILSRSRNSFTFRVVVYRIRLFTTSISKNKIP